MTDEQKAFCIAQINECLSQSTLRVLKNTLENLKLHIDQIQRAQYCIDNNLPHSFAGSGSYFFHLRILVKHTEDGSYIFYNEDDDDNDAYEGCFKILYDLIVNRYNEDASQFVTEACDAVLLYQPQVFGIQAYHIYFKLE